MRLHESIGQPIVRTEPGPSGDRTYCTKPIVVDSICQGIIYIKDLTDGKNAKIRILDPGYNDDMWSPVSKKFLKQISEESQ